jgi:hypothetical protein
MPKVIPMRWNSLEVEVIPASAYQPDQIASFARQLNERERTQVVHAFDAGHFEMGTTFVWSRTMAGLKNRLSVLGIQFIAEMLDRPDIRPSAQVHEVLTDYDAVRLAEELGMVGSTQALRLRQSLSLVAHFANRPDDAVDDEMMPEEALGTLRTCVQTVLGHDNLDVAVEFSEFRRRLETTILGDTSPEVEGIASSAYFFQRTVLRTLLAGSKSARSAHLENVLANLNILLPLIWPTLKDPDRYMVGRAYADLHAEGHASAASGLRSALLKISGFDYVPEGLRSRAFIEAAAKVQTAHFGWENFYNEPAPMRALASLGSSIPIPAFHRCITAIILVKIGNPYGVSDAALPYASEMLEDVTADRWKYFFDDCLPVDDVLLGELLNEKVGRRWCTMVAELPRLRGVITTNKGSKLLFDASVGGDPHAVSRRASSLLASMREKRS